MSRRSHPSSSPASPPPAPQANDLAVKRQKENSTLDLVAGIFSPLVIILFVVLMIIGLDEYAAHYQKVTQFEKNMIISTGIWEYFHNDGKSGWVKIQDERCLNTLYLDTRYYSAAALATLEDGKEVRVRYSVPDCRAYLDVYYAEFRYNLKGLQEFIPLFLFCVMVLILKPDFLYLGLIDLSDTPDPAEKP